MATNAIAMINHETTHTVPGQPGETAGHRIGLSGAEAARRLTEDGPNQLPDQTRRAWAAILAEAAREPMFLLLCGAAGLYLLLGEPHESGFLIAMVAVTLGLTLYQEGRTEKALQALRDLNAPQAIVIRDGQSLRIPAAALVRGDTVVLTAGDRVPADALLIEAGGMMVDESLLTGESVPVAKRAGAADSEAAAPGGDGQPWVYGGTLVVQGDGLAAVRATGARSELGRIGTALSHITPPQGRLQRETRMLARRLSVLGITVSLLLVLVIGMRDGNWLQALLAGVALSMSMLPAEFPVILTIFPALGAWRLAQRQVLTRRLGAIEVLGSTSVLCVDKTGTLTENRMALRVLWRDGVRHDIGAEVLPPAHCDLLTQAVLASRPPSTDPIERALHLVAARAAAQGGSAPAAWRLEREYGLTDTRPALIRICAGSDGSRAFAKGAPETIVALCGYDAGADVLPAAAALAAEGLRVLAVAMSAPLAPPWPDDPGLLPFRLAGLVAFADPLRDDIPEAVAQCRAAGIRVLMVTGDHPATAESIARQAGLAAGGTLTGADIAQLTPGTLAARLAGVSVCARIVPSQKLAIVRALQQTGAVVAMTGDGVNDAPALRAADVGVAMGKRGTDVAREAAELTLLDDRFPSLVNALRAGRRIYSNMRKSMRYITAIHAPIAVLALLPPLAGWPILLYPVHIVILQLVIDPACSLAFENEPEEAELMHRPPRRHDEPLFSRATFLAALASGLWTSALLGGGYALALATLTDTEAHTVAFSALILCNLALLVLYRQPHDIGAAIRTPNAVLLAIVSSALVLLGSAIYFPPLAAIFRFAPVPPVWMVVVLLIPLAVIVGVLLARRAARSGSGAAPQASGGVR